MISYDLQKVKYELDNNAKLLEQAINDIKNLETALRDIKTLSFYLTADFDNNEYYEWTYRTVLKIIHGNNKELIISTPHHGPKAITFPSEVFKDLLSRASSIHGSTAKVVFDPNGWEFVSDTKHDDQRLSYWKQKTVIP